MPRLSSFRPAPAVFAAALAGILSIQPAAAQDGVGAPYAHNDWHDPRPEVPPPTGRVPTVPAPGTQVAAQALPAEAIPGRAQWLAECRRRVADRDDWQREFRRERRKDRGHRAPGPDECESYLDDYYASARAHHEQQMQAYAGRGLAGQPMHMMPMPMNHGHAMEAGGHGGECCRAAPMMMAPSGPYMLVPVMLPARQANCEREVIETIEEVVPARRIVPRRAPPRDKRIRIAPDKRVRTQ